MTLSRRLRAGETVFTAWSGVPDALTVEIVAAQRFGAVTLDMQHGGHHEDSVLRCIPAVMAAGNHPVVRIPVGRFDMASRALDFGAEAVIAPMVNSLEDARRFGAAMKYPPVGERSWGPTFALPRHKGADLQEWLRTANSETLALAMIETRAALEIVDGILETPGIDGVFVGPADFSIAWSLGERLDPTRSDMEQAVADIARKVLAAGKVCGIYVVEPELSGRFVAMGYRFLALGGEHRLIATGAASLLGAAEKSLR